jgi:hypothetical protein
LGAGEAIADRALVFLHRFDPPPPPELDRLATSLEQTLAEEDQAMIAPGEPGSPLDLALDRIAAQQRFEVALIRRLSRETGRLSDGDERQAIVEEGRRVADHAWRLQRRKKRLARRR